MFDGGRNGIGAELCPAVNAADRRFEFFVFAWSEALYSGDRLFLWPLAGSIAVPQSTRRNSVRPELEDFGPGVHGESIHPTGSFPFSDRCLEHFLFKSLHSLAYLP